MVGGRWLWAIVCACVAILGCHRDARDYDVDTRVAALTAAGNEILGFENPADWPVTQGSIPAPVKSTTHTEGSSSLAVKAQGYLVITSASFAVSASIMGPFLYDFFLPTQQPNPSWFGQTQLYLNCPSLSVFNAYVGAVELTGLATNRFVTLSVPLPAALIPALNKGCADLSLAIAVNVPTNATGTYLVDNLRFGGSGSRVKATANCVATQDGTNFTAYFGYQNLESQLVTIPIGPSNGFTPAGITVLNQPTVFQTGTTPIAVAATFTSGQTVTWALTSGSASATAQSPRCTGSVRTQLTCADAQRQSPNGCVRFVQLPMPRGPSQDPAVLGQPFDSSTAPPPGGEEENEADTENAQLVPVAPVELLPTQTKTIPFTISAKGAVFANARWSTPGKVSLSLQVGSKVVTGVPTNSALDQGGALDASAAAPSNGSGQVIVQNTGTTPIPAIRVVIAIHKSP